VNHNITIFDSKQKIKTQNVQDCILCMVIATEENHEASTSGNWLLSIQKHKS